MTKIQFIICTHNNKDIIEECLKSVYALKKKKDWKIKVMVVDDDSQDNTADTVRSYNRSHNKNTEVAQCFSNLGPAYCRNFGYKNSRADLYFFCDSDIVLDKNCLIQLIEWINKPYWRGTCGIVGPKLLLPNGRINSVGGELSKIGYGFDRGYMEKEKRDRYEVPKECMYICSAAMLIKNEVIDVIGLFDETYFYGHEDADLGWRANLAGYKVIYVPTAIAAHKKSYTVKKNKGLVYYHGTKNKFRSIIKNYNFKNMIIYGSLYKLILFFDIIFRPYRKEKIRAWWWLIRNAESHLKERKGVQALRRRKDSALPFTGLLPK